MKILFCLLALVLISCSHSIVVKTPASRFLSAESQGKPLKGNFKIFYGFGKEAQMDLRNGQTNNELKIENDEIRFFDIIVNGEIGIYGPVDLIHISGGRLGSDITGAKIQIWGDSREKAAKYNFSTSLLAGYGQVVNNQNEGDDLEFTAQDDDTTTELNVSNQAYGILFGYRHAENLLVNLGYYQHRHNFYGELESQNINLDGKNVNYVGTSHVITIGTFYYVNSTVIGLELSSDTTKWDHTQQSTVSYGNIAFGYVW